MDEILHHLGALNYCNSWDFRGKILGFRALVLGLGAITMATHMKTMVIVVI